MTIESIKTLEFCHKDAILARHGQLTRESYSIYPYFCLSQGTFQINKHNHVKQIDAESTEILLRKRKRIKTFGFCHNEDILSPHGPLAY